MIEFLRKIATKIIWARPIVIVIGFGFLGLFLYSILGSNGADQELYLIPSVVGLLWALAFNILIVTFPHVPDKPDHQVGLFTRLKINFKRFGYQILALIFVALSIVVLLFSFKVIGVWVNSAK